MVRQCELRRLRRPHVARKTRSYSRCGFGLPRPIPPFAIYTLRSTLPVKWMGCLSAAQHHSGPQVSTNSCNNLLSGRHLLFWLATLKGTPTPRYNVVVSALYRLLCHAMALPKIVSGAWPYPSDPDLATLGEHLVGQRSSHCGTFGSLGRWSSMR